MAYEEEEFDQMRIGNVMIRQQGPCVRCKAMSVNWNKFCFDENLEPYMTLTKDRMLKGVGPIFGMYFAFDILP